MKKTMSDYEKSVRIGLIKNDMTMAKLAVTLGISKTYLYDIINGSRNSVKNRARINAVLGIADECNSQN